MANDFERRSDQATDGSWGAARRRMTVSVAIPDACGTTPLAQVIVLALLRRPFVYGGLARVSVN